MEYEYCYNKKAMVFVSGGGAINNTKDDYRTTVWYGTIP
jgi:hypothetical protein